MVNFIFGRGTVTMVDDGHDVQRVQVASGNEVLDDLCRIQNYGLTAVPPVGAKALVLFAGSREDAVVTHADGPGRPKLEAGDVALYTDQGDSVVLKRGHHIALSTKALAIKNGEGELICTSSQLPTFHFNSQLR